MNCLARPVFRMEGQPSFVQRPEVAAAYEYVEAEKITARKVPCICPEQDRGACGRTISYSTSRGHLRERVACDRCPRTWTRVNA